MSINHKLSGGPPGGFNQTQKKRCEAQDITMTYCDRYNFYKLIRGEPDLCPGTCYYAKKRTWKILLKESMRAMIKENTPNLYK